MIGRLLRALVVVAVVTCTTRAFAESPVTLDWNASAAADCPSGADVVAEVERILGSSPGARRAVSARADVTKTPAGGVRVKLVTRGPDVAGRRTFDAASCKEIASACALILAMTVNPQLPPPDDGTPEPSPPAAEARGEPTPPTPPPKSGAPRAGAEAPPQRPTSATITTSARPKRFGASASFVADVGSLPSVAAGGEFALTFAPSRLRIELASRLWAPSRATITTNAGADLDLLAASARGGYALLKTGSLNVGPILGLEVERIRARGFGGTSAFSPDATFVGGSVGVLSVWAPFAEVRAFAFRLLVEAAVPFERPQFVVREPAPAASTEVFRAAALGGRVVLGAELFFF